MIDRAELDFGLLPLIEDDWLAFNGLQFNGDSLTHLIPLQR